MAEQLGIIKRPTYGVNDRGLVGLTFQVFVSEGLASQQFLSHDDLYPVIQDSNVSDINNLEGKPCWVEKDGNIMRFKRIWKN